MIDNNNDILLLITEAFGLDIGLGQIAHHRLSRLRGRSEQHVCKGILVISLSLSQAEQ